MKVAVLKLLYIMPNCHTESTESTEMFYPEEGVLHSFYKKLRSVKTENNWE